MNKEIIKKLFDMMHSSDKEMSRLGLETFRGYVTDYTHFKTFRGISIKGAPFFPIGLKMEVRTLGRELRKTTKVHHGKQARRKDRFNAKGRSRDEASSLNNPLQGS